MRVRRVKMMFGSDVLFVQLGLFTYSVHDESVIIYRFTSLLHNVLCRIRH